LGDTKRYCPECGAIIRDNVVYCVKCGANIYLAKTGIEIRRTKDGHVILRDGAPWRIFPRLGEKMIREMANNMGVPREALEAEFAKATLQWEEERRRRGRKANPQKADSKPEEQEKKEEEIDGETREKALSLLRRPDFFYRLGLALERGFTVPKINKVRFVIREERNKRLVPILIGASAKRSLTSIIRLIGETGTCKDALIRLALWLISPGAKYEERGSLTAGGFRHSQEIKEADILYLPDSPELRGEQGRQYRLMRSDDGGLTYEYALKDPETGQMTTYVGHIPVKIIVTTSNEINIDPALESGAWTLETDSSAELTREVQIEKLRLRAGLRPTLSDEELKVWRAAFRIALTEELPDEIKIPYAEALSFLLSNESTAQRRSPDKLCDLIEAVAFWRRFQKPPEKRGEADVADLYIALQLGLEALMKTLAPLDQKERAVIEAVKNCSNNATVRDVVTALPFKESYHTVYARLERLVDKGYLVKDKAGNRNVYSAIMEKPGEEKGEEAGRAEKKEEYLLSTLNKSSLDIIPLMRQFYKAVSNSQTLIEIYKQKIHIIDPVTGEEVRLPPDGEEAPKPQGSGSPPPPGGETMETVDTKPEAQKKFVVLSRSGEEFESSKRGEETATSDENKPENLLIRVDKRDNEQIQPSPREEGEKPPETEEASPPSGEVDTRRCGNCLNYRTPNCPVGGIIVPTALYAQKCDRFEAKPSDSRTTEGPASPDSLEAEGPKAPEAEGVDSRQDEPPAPEAGSPHGGEDESKIPPSLSMAVTLLVDKVSTLRLEGGRERIERLAELLGWPLEYAEKILKIAGWNGDLWEAPAKTIRLPDDGEETVI